MSILFITSIIFAVYSIASLALSLKKSVKYKIFLASVFIICSLKFFIYRYTGGILEPALDAQTVLIIECAYAFVMLCAFLALFKDLACLLIYITSKLIKKQQAKLSSNLVNHIILVTAAVFSVYGTLYQLKTPEVKTVEVYIDDLPSEMESLNIVQLTDLHIGPILKHDFLNTVVTSVNSLKPDLVLLTGDYVDGSVEKNAGEFRSLAKLESTYGIYAVTGNHEYYSQAIKWVDHLSSYKIRFLDNEHVALDIKGSNLIIGGSPDLKAPAFGFKGPDSKKAYENAKKGIRIYLSHEPATVVYDRPDADLMLSGHTHGGIMFFLQPLIAYFNEGYVSGLYQIDDRLQLYVSNGTGIWSGFSCRIFVPSEITLIKLKRKI